MPRKSSASKSVAPLEVSGRAGPLRPSATLTPDAAAIFAAAIAAARPGHFSELDRVALEEFAQAAARCRRAETAIARQGDVVKGKPNPWLLVLRDARHQVTNLLPKLRLCPSARVQAKQVAPGNEGRALADTLLQRLPS